MFITSDAGGFQMGMVLGTAMIASVGPVTLMIVREGMAGGRKLLVASTVCGVQLALIAAALAFADAISGLGTAFRTRALWLGLVCTAWFAVQSFRTTTRNARLDLRGHPDETVGGCAMRALAVVAMNPLTYVNRFLLPASMAQGFATPDMRLQFALGLIAMTVVGAYGCALSGAMLLRVLRHRLSLKVFDRTSGVLLSGVTTKP